MIVQYGRRTNFQVRSIFLEQQSGGNIPTQEIISSISQTGVYAKIIIIDPDSQFVNTISDWCQ